MTMLRDLPPVRSPRLVLRATILFAWGLLLAVLLATGGLDRYLAPRNVPFVLVAAPTLMALGAGQWRRSRIPHTGDPEDAYHENDCLCRWEEAPRRWDLVTSALLVLPLVVLAIVPTGSLGAAAARSRGVRTVAIKAPPRGDRAAVETSASGAREVTVLDMVYASANQEYASQLGIKPGSMVRMIGLAVKGGRAPADGFLLTRFLVTCCVADAVPIAIRVHGRGAGEVRDNAWVAVEGAISWTPAPRGELASDVNADLTLERVQPVASPDDPYLY